MDNNATDEKSLYSLFEHWASKLIVAAISLISITWMIALEFKVEPEREKVSDITAKYDLLEKTHNQMINDWETKKNDFTSSSTEVKKYRDELKTTNDQATKYKNDLERAVASITNLNNEIDNANGKIKEKENIITEKANKIDQLLGSIASKDKEIEYTTKKMKENSDAAIKMADDIQKIISQGQEETKKMTEEREGISEIRKNVNDLITLWKKSESEKEKFKLPTMIQEIAKSTKSMPCSSGNGDLEINTNFSQNNEQMNVDFYVDAKVNFKPGKYSIEEAYQSTCFIELVGKFIKDVKQINLEHNELEIDGLFEGGADTLQKSYVGRYEGDLGELVVIDNAKVNGIVVNKSFKKGDKITNSELALLRSYSVYKTFLSLADSNYLKLIERSVNFSANEYPESNSKYRFGKITVQLTRKELANDISLLKSND